MTSFVDTNLLVYTRDPADPLKQQVSRRWIEHLWSEREGRLSFQVLQEYYVTVTMKLTPGLTKEEARDDIAALTAWNPLPIDSRVINGSWRNQDRHGFSWWDSLIVSAAQILNCTYLLTEDLQHEQSVDGVTIINPFALGSPTPPT